MLLVNDAVYLDLWDIEHAINDGTKRHSDASYIHVITKSRVVICNLVSVSSDREAEKCKEGKTEEKAGEKDPEEAEAEKNNQKKDQKQKQQPKPKPKPKEKMKEETKEMMCEKWEQQGEPNELTSGSVSIIGGWFWAGGAAILKTQLR